MPEVMCVCVSDTHCIDLLKRLIADFSLFNLGIIFVFKLYTFSWVTQLDYFWYTFEYTNSNILIRIYWVHCTHSNRSIRMYSFEYSHSNMARSNERVRIFFVPFDWTYWFDNIK